MDQAIDRLPVKPESRDGYERDKFRLWVDADGNGCNARYEVLISEAVKKPDVGPKCKLTGGEWYSYYDGKTWTNPTDLDIDHLVPLAEAWDSGASQWDAKKRERYANDLDFAPTLVAVTDTVNQDKSDQDPSQWLPDREVCRYLTEWVTVKLHWGLAVDAEEVAAIKSHTACWGSSAPDQATHKP